MKNKQIKKLLLLVLILSLLINTVVFAENTDTESITDELEKIGIEYGLQLTEINENYEGPILNFDSIEEFKEFMAKKNDEALRNGINLKSNTINLSISATEKSVENKSLYAPMETSATIYSDSHHWQKYSPYTNFWVTGVSATKHIYFDYQYYFESNVPRFYSVTNVESILGGFNLGTWVQVKVNPITYTNNTSDSIAHISIEGYYFFGISINGIPAGYVDIDTWELNYKLY